MASLPMVASTAQLVAFVDEPTSEHPPRFVDGVAAFLFLRTHVECNNTRDHGHERADHKPYREKWLAHVRATFTCMWGFFPTTTTLYEMVTPFTSTSWHS